MSKTGLGIIAVVVIVLAILFVWPGLLTNRATAPTEELPAVATPPPPPPTPPEQAKVIIEITKTGFSPSSFTTKRGTMVEFINRDTAPHWPASGVHPAHLVCPGFDAAHGLAKDESYIHIFSNEPKTCPMHDHLNPALKGSIEVTE